MTQENQTALEIMQEARRKLSAIGARRAQWFVCAAIDDYLGLKPEAQRNRRYAKKFCITGAA